MARSSGAIESYRRRYGIAADDPRPLGPEPPRASFSSARTETRPPSATRRSRHQLDPPGQRADVIRTRTPTTTDARRLEAIDQPWRRARAMSSARRRRTAAAATDLIRARDTSPMHGCSVNADPIRARQPRCSRPRKHCRRPGHRQRARSALPSTDARPPSARDPNDGTATSPSPFDARQYPDQRNEPAARRRAPEMRVSPSPLGSTPAAHDLRRG